MSQSAFRGLLEEFRNRPAFGQRHGAAFERAVGYGLWVVAQGGVAGGVNVGRRDWPRDGIRAVAVGLADHLAAAASARAETLWEVGSTLGRIQD